MSDSPGHTIGKLLQQLFDNHRRLTVCADTVVLLAVDGYPVSGAKVGEGQTTGRECVLTFATCCSFGLLRPRSSAAFMSGESADIGLRGWEVQWWIVSRKLVGSW